MFLLLRVVGDISESGKAANGGSGRSHVLGYTFADIYGIANVGKYYSDNGKIMFGGGGGCGNGNPDKRWGDPDKNGLGGNGGGGDGETTGLALTSTPSYVHGEAHTGGGGGGSRFASGGNGGSGVVIIRYKKTKFSYLNQIYLKFQ